MSLAWQKINVFFQQLVQELKKRGLRVNVVEKGSFIAAETIKGEAEGSPAIFVQAHLTRLDSCNHVSFQASVNTPAVGLKPGYSGSPQMELLNAIRDKARVLYPSLLQQDGYEGYFLNVSDESVDSAVIKKPAELAKELLFAVRFYESIFTAAMRQFREIEERRENLERARLGSEALRLITDNFS